MRVISQDGTIDIPYETSILHIVTSTKAEYSKSFIFYTPNNSMDSNELARYSTEAKAQKAMEMLRTAYAGRFVTNADVSDDFNEQLKELMKGGFGTVIVNDRYDSRVEFNNLNGYFQFPQDEDVEV